jgi:NAD(P)-dependent dehydrogenase (short-subunit alcohol dehydrogenase family)
VVILTAPRVNFHTRFRVAVVCGFHVPSAESSRPLTDKVALITGASKGLGKAMAAALATSGAHVALVSRDREKLGAVADELEQAGGRATVFVADVTSEDHVRRLESDVSRQLGRVQILINNAGINIRKNLVDFSLDEWRSVLDTNLTSVFLMCRAFVPHMRGTGYGRILNMSSIMSHVSLPGRSAYSSSKAALLGLIRALALELAPEGITVNGISPGPFGTEMNLPVMNDPQANAQFLASIPAARWGKVVDRRSRLLSLLRGRQLHHRNRHSDRWRLVCPMTRRDAMSAIACAVAAAGASEFFGGWLRAAESHSFAPPEPDRFTNYKPKFFSAEELTILDEFTAILIPSDETPGAREAHVAAFIDFVVDAAAEYEPELQQDWRGAVQFLERRKFASLSPQRQCEFVEKMSHAGAKGYLEFQLIKEMTVHAFYTSRVGLIDVLNYQGNAYLTEFPGCNHPEHREV